MKLCKICREKTEGQKRKKYVFVIGWVTLGEIEKGEKVRLAGDELGEMD